LGFFSVTIEGYQTSLIRNCIYATKSWLDLAGYCFDNPYAEFGIGGEGFEMEGRSGVIGRGLMGPFVVVFDYRHKRMAFIR
jgi:hypothetical protein